MYSERQTRQADEHVNEQFAKQANEIEVERTNGKEIEC